MYAGIKYNINSSTTIKTTIRIIIGMIMAAKTPIPPPPYNVIPIIPLIYGSIRRPTKSTANKLIPSNTNDFTVASPVSYLFPSILKITFL